MPSYRPASTTVSKCEPTTITGRAPPVAVEPIRFPTRSTRVVIPAARIHPSSSPRAATRAGVP